VNTRAKPIKDASGLKILDSTLPSQPYKRWKAANRPPTEDLENLGSFIVWQVYCKSNSSMGQV